jgi:hypothetical protein
MVAVSGSAVDWGNCVVVAGGRVLLLGVVVEVWLIRSSVRILGVVVVEPAEVVVEN